MSSSKIPARAFDIQQKAQLLRAARQMDVLTLKVRQMKHCATVASVERNLESLRVYRDSFSQQLEGFERELATLNAITVNMRALADERKKVKR